MDYIGEGLYRTWVDGEFGGLGPAGTLDAWDPATEPEPPRWVVSKWVRKPDQHWWIKARRDDGREGWFEDPPDHYMVGQDFCG